MVAFPFLNDQPVRKKTVLDNLGQHSKRMSIRLPWVLAIIPIKIPIPGSILIKTMGDISFTFSFTLRCNPLLVFATQLVLMNGTTPASCP